MNRRGFVGGMIASAALGPYASNWAGSEVFAARIFRDAQGTSMPYRLFTPRRARQDQKYPLVLWLHGAGGLGHDNLSQISIGNRIGSHVWTLSANQARNPCFVVAPQCPAGYAWADFESGLPTDKLNLALALVEELQRNNAIDAQRLYIAGQSLGGFGTWAAISDRPRMFAAAIPIAGGGRESLASRLTSIPIWAFHGEKDEAVKVERSRDMIAAIRRAGGKPKYTEYKGAGHLIWSRVFGESDLLPWVFAQQSGPDR